MAIGGKMIVATAGGGAVGVVDVVAASNVVQFVVTVMSAISSVEINGKRLR